MGRGGIADVFEKIDEYSMLLAAVAHDVGHPGMNNIYQVKAKTDLAITYNDTSCLENMHAARTFKIILKPGTQGGNVNVFESLTPDQFN
ncbi:hypothetical protein ACHAXS_002947, partial [Conticribra weissflogii]